MRLYCVLFLNSLLLMAVPSFASDGEITLDLLPDSAPTDVRDAESQALAVMYDFMLHRCNGLRGICPAFQLVP